jgi:hypothetical protein
VLINGRYSVPKRQRCKLIFNLCRVEKWVWSDSQSLGSVLDKSSKRSIHSL